MKLAARLIFLVVLAGGLFFWLQLRKPRDMRVELDLTRSTPGEIVAVDLIVRRSGQPLMRLNEQYQDMGAPGTVALTVHATPGEAEVEANLVYAKGRTRRVVQAVKLGDMAARITP